MHMSSILIKILSTTKSKSDSFPCIIKLLDCCKHSQALLIVDYRISQKTDHEHLNEALGYITWEKYMYSDKCNYLLNFDVFYHTAVAAPNHA